MTSLSEIRKQINKLDTELMVLLKKRILLCEQLARIKKKSRLPLTDKSRELEIITRLQSKMKSHFSNTEIEVFINTILRLSKQRMKKITNK